MGRRIEGEYTSERERERDLECIYTLKSTIYSIKLMLSNYLYNISSIKMSIKKIFQIFIYLLIYLYTYIYIYISISNIGISLYT